jgi:hypothetical protein
MLSSLFYVGTFFIIPIAFLVYRKLEYAHRVARSRAHGNCAVQKPIFTGILQRWINRQPFDVGFYHTLFLRHGRTFTTHPLIKPLVMTIDPENIKTVLATKFGEFDIGHFREDIGQQYMQKGIFTTQASEWHVSNTPAS